MAYCKVTPKQLRGESEESHKKICQENVSEPIFEIIRYEVGWLSAFLDPTVVMRTRVERCPPLLE